MPLATRVKSSEYHDSVTLMLVAKALTGLPGVLDAAVVMGTPANRDILADAGLLSEQAAAARPDDLVIVVKADDAAAGHAALAEADRLLAQRAGGGPSAAGAGPRRPRTLASAIAAAPDANLAVISVAGRYAAAEARAALEAGLHVLLFSDNVALEDEISLKRLAAARGLLCMGPDAGTAIINGVALGFANAVPRGPVGLVGAAGTGLQAVSTGLARRGCGVSQAIGTGGRDLSEAVGGVMMLAGLRMLQADPDTHVIVLVSKPPAVAVAAQILAQVGRSAKPVVVCFLGADLAPIEAAGAHAAATLNQAAVMAAALAAGRDPRAALTEQERAYTALVPQAEAARCRRASGQWALRGLFAGGTFCYEAQLALRGLPDPVYSNAPLAEANRLTGGAPAGHTCIDLGADEFTQGRLHPMIDPTLRNRRIVEAATDPAAAAVLFDVVLGYGAHADPAGAAADAVRQGRAAAEAAGRCVAFVASVCGAEDDPQVLSRQEAALAEAGVIVAPDNATAARLAGLIISR